MKLLIVGHACSPGLGSEPGITWNWADALSKLHEVWVIAHPEYRALVEAHLAEEPNPNLHMEYVTPRFDPWDPSKGERWLKLHYVAWLRAALLLARDLHAEIGFDLVHHVSLGTVQTGSPFWKLGIPSVWGPVGGGQTFPAAFSPGIGERLRSLRVACAVRLPGVRRTIRNASLILATNRETQQMLTWSGARRVELFMDGGASATSEPFEPHCGHARLRLLWAGRIEPRKGLPLVLEAMASCPSADLTVAGDGPAKWDCQVLAERLRLRDRVAFLGRVAPQNMPALFRTHDAFVFSSLRDTFGTVVLEAMSHGLPAIVLAHQGVGAFVPQGAAVRVPVTIPAITVDGLGAGFRYLAGSPGRCREMGRAAWDWAQLNSWENRAKTMTRLYEGVSL